MPIIRDTTHKVMGGSRLHRPKPIADIRFDKIFRQAYMIWNLLNTSYLLTLVVVRRCSVLDARSFIMCVWLLAFTSCCGNERACTEYPVSSKRQISAERIKNKDGTKVPAAARMSIGHPGQLTIIHPVCTVRCTIIVVTLNRQID
jgi:hypothetical protein